MLHEYTYRAFNNDESALLGEVVGKLRVLVCETTVNKPLLLRLMEDLGIDERITLRGPPTLLGSRYLGPGHQVTLREYMELDACGVTLGSGEFKMLTKRQFVLAWAQQCGAAHEDWEIDEALALALDPSLQISGQPMANAVLSDTTKTVLDIAERVLREIKS